MNRTCLKSKFENEEDDENDGNQNLFEEIEDLNNSSEYILKSIETDFKLYL